MDLQVETDHAVEVVPKSGHFVFLEQPQRFNAALFRTTAPYLPQGLAEKLIQREEQDRLQVGPVVCKSSIRQQVAPATALLSGTDHRGSSIFFQMIPGNPLQHRILHNLCCFPC